MSWLSFPDGPAFCSWRLPSGGKAQASFHTRHLEFRSQSPRGVSGPPAGLRGSPRGCVASLADVALHGALTPTAGDVAAPMVLAVAALDHAVCVGVVAASTAHEVAAVAAMRGLVALPGGGWGGQ